MLTLRTAATLGGGGGGNPDGTAAYGYLANPVDVRQYQDLLDGFIDMVQSQGPFDGLMGFSEGGILAATLLLEDARRPFANFRCALLFSAAPPLDPDALRDGSIKCLDPAKDTTVSIHVPTAHVYSHIDDAVRTGVPNLVSPLYNLWAEKGWTTPEDVHGSLARLCEQPQVFVHDCGHRIPGSRDPQALRGMLRVVERTVGSLAD